MFYILRKYDLSLKSCNNEILKEKDFMDDSLKKNDELEQIDDKELELPETTFIRDIESRVFQAITLQCLAKIEGISLLGGTLIDNLLGREGMDRIKGIHVEQDQKNHSIYVRVEINIQYGIAIPEKAEEIQSKIIEEISTLTGLHVSCVHVVFKNLIINYQKEQEEAVVNNEIENEEETVAALTDESSDDYSEGF
jgi:uncharacterized alkaline shock family protein YloU